MEFLLSENLAYFSVPTPGKPLKVLDFWSDFQAVESPGKWLWSLKVKKPCGGPGKYWKNYIGELLWHYINAVLLLKNIINY